MLDSQVLTQRPLMFAGGTELLASHDDPPQIPVGGMFIRERDSSEHL
jgi:hypothetical protein